MSVEVRYQNTVAYVNEGETVLDALERTGKVIPSSCRAGACQFCIVRLVSGSVPKVAQESLKESLRATGHFLACVCKPTEPIECEPANVAPFRDYVSLREITPIGPDVVRVRFDRPENFSFTPGQFVTVQNTDGIARSYSIASQEYEKNFFDVHVRRVPNGKLSTWFHDHAKPGDLLWLEGPKGDCIYVEGQPDAPLTLIGTGTGIAPLFAIVRNAIDCGHNGPITMYHAAPSEDRLYYIEELSSFAEQHSNVAYHKVVKQGIARNDLQVGDIKDIVTFELVAPRDHRVYLCGDPGLVRILKKHMFLAGVSIARIHADPFIGTMM
jgi:CDP-4-dehydro-6-deoxyglucose reductase